MEIVAIILASVLLLSVAGFLFLIFPACRRHPERERMKGIFIAHRGLHGLDKDCPENSLAAFRAAIERGYAIEIDIHLTKDGEVVVFHDDNTQRMCGVYARPERVTLEDLKTLFLAGTTEQIPTLQECLDTVNGQVPLLIEFKCGAETCKELCQKANEILSDYEGIYWVQSFYPPVLRWYRRHRKDICRGQLSSAFYREAVHKQALGCLLFNFISRPDFVSYNHRNVGNIFRKISIWLGAYPVGWTFREQAAVDDCRRAMGTYIFEGFIPNEEE